MRKVDLGVREGDCGKNRNVRGCSWQALYFGCIIYYFGNWILRIFICKRQHIHYAGFMNSHNLNRKFRILEGQHIFVAKNFQLRKFT